ncbi:hypothetical protein SAMN04489735_100272 [Aneurinibacillus thermoaerophilus]|uniref:Resolvase, N terminal domain n=1 Tax=Aneurinibacillus thermoaerophilus TaxID=143495 RepID=A0A1G7WR22_ANETH|nr:hypothetical protein [Aneurinibacillus thermoaerophilus]SDG74328.1 hypothetical protein SAMN04489735_100272 [Aneurinibacillus thermoaerophilus]
MKLYSLVLNDNNYFIKQYVKDNNAEIVKEQTYRPNEYFNYPNLEEIKMEMKNIGAEALILNDIHDLQDINTFEEFINQAEKNNIEVIFASQKLKTSKKYTIRELVFYLSRNFYN